MNDCDRKCWLKKVTDKLKGMGDESAKAVADGLAEQGAEADVAVAETKMQAKEQKVAGAVFQSVLSADDVSDLTQQVNALQEKVIDLTRNIKIFQLNN